MQARSLRQCSLTVCLGVSLTELIGVPVIISNTVLGFVFRVFGLWTAVTLGTRLGMLQLDDILYGIVRTLLPGVFKYQAPNVAVPLLACFQVCSTAMCRTVACNMLPETWCAVGK